MKMPVRRQKFEFTPAFGSHCNWRWRGLEGFMDDYGNFIFLAGNL